MGTQTELHGSWNVPPRMQQHSLKETLPRSLREERKRRSGRALCVPAHRPRDTPFSCIYDRSIFGGLHKCSSPPFSCSFDPLFLSVTLNASPPPRYAWLLKPNLQPRSQMKSAIRMTPDSPDVQADSKIGQFVSDPFPLHLVSVDLKCMSLFVPLEGNWTRTRKKKPNLCAFSVSCSRHKNNIGGLCKVQLVEFKLLLPIQT